MRYDLKQMSMDFASGRLYRLIDVATGEYASLIIPEERLFTWYSAKHNLKAKIWRLERVS